MNYKKGKISQQIHKDRLKRMAPRITGITGILQIQKFRVKNKAVQRFREIHEIRWK